MLPGLGNAEVVDASTTADVAFFSYQDFLTPSSLFLVARSAPEKVKTAPAFFDASGMRVEQYEATAKDGVKIPYFVVTPKGFRADGRKTGAWWMPSSRRKSSKLT